MLVRISKQILGYKLIHSFFTITEWKKTWDSRKTEETNAASMRQKEVTCKLDAREVQLFLFVQKNHVDSIAINCNTI